MFSEYAACHATPSHASLHGRRIAVNDITEIYEGKQTEPFMKPSAASAKDEHCFSIVALVS